MFNSLEEKDMQFHIEFRDDGVYLTKGVSIVSFEREYGSLLHLNIVMYVLRLKENLFLVAVLEDKVYDVVFNKGKAYVKHSSLG